MSMNEVILQKIKDAYGIVLTEIHTGGGCYALEGRLETGHWIVATDLDCHLFSSRLGFEWDGPAMGWCVGIYDDVDGYWGEEAVLQVTDHNAAGWQLPKVIEFTMLKLLESVIAGEIMWSD